MVCIVGIIFDFIIYKCSSIAYSSNNGVNDILVKKRVLGSTQYGRHEHNFVEFDSRFFVVPFRNVVVDRIIDDIQLLEFLCNLNPRIYFVCSLGVQQKP